MKVTLIIERMDPTLGGRETYTAMVAEELARRNVELTIVCQTAHWSCPGVRIIELGVRGVLRHLRTANFIADAQKQMQQRGDGIVHAMLPVPEADVYQPHSGTMPAQYLATRRRRGRLLSSLSWVSRVFNLSRRLAGRLERQIVADESACCLCVSPMIAREFEQLYGRTRNVRVILNGAKAPPADDPRRAEWRRQHRQELGIAPDCVVFVVVATNLKLKGVPEAIAALGRWRRVPDAPLAHLLVVGGNKRSIASCGELARRYRVVDRVHFLGHRTDVFEWYATADVNLLLSWYDSCGLTVLEAARWGLPSIVSSYAGVAEVVRGEVGRVVDSPRDLDAVVSAYQEMSNSTRREAYSRACLELAPKLTLEHHVEELTALYDQLLAERASQRR